MSTTPDRRPVEPDADADGRYVAIDVPKDQVMVYDVDDGQAWIQSDTAIDLETME